MTEGKQAKKLTKKQEVFISEYLISFNATKAAKAAGYSEDSARFQGSRLLADDNIKQHIQDRLAEVHMSADEALKLRADIARGDIAQLMDVSSVGFNLDMAKAKKLGLTKLIKKVKQRTTIYSAKKESEEDREVTELEIELYPADVAQNDILKIAGRYRENVDITTGGDKIKTYVGWSPDQWKNQDVEK